MIQKNSILRNFDNSGISIIKCIEVLSKRKESKLLDFVKFVIKKFSKFKKRRVIKVKKNILYKGVILTQNLFYKRKNGFFIKFDIIKVIGISKRKLLGSRIKGNIMKEVKKLLNIKKKKSDIIRKIILKSRFIL